MTKIKITLSYHIYNYTFLVTSLPFVLWFAVHVIHIQFLYWDPFLFLTSCLYISMYVPILSLAFHLWKWLPFLFAFHLYMGVLFVSMTSLLYNGIPFLMITSNLYNGILFMSFLSSLYNGIPFLSLTSHLYNRIPFLSFPSNLYNGILFVCITPIDIM